MVTYDLVNRLSSMMDVVQGMWIPNLVKEKSANVAELCAIMLEHQEGDYCIGEDVGKYIDQINEHLFYLQRYVCDGAMWCLACEKRLEQINQLAFEVDEVARKIRREAKASRV